MFPNLTEALVTEGAAALARLIHGGAWVGRLMSPLGKFVHDRLDFFVHHPAVSLSGLLVNLLIIWWLVRAPKIVAPDFDRSAHPLDPRRSSPGAWQPLQAVTKEVG
jgi:hypothetical protein